ncbi:TonB-dependent receptor [Aquimarina sp. MMG016]|uniref:TonB-dependent receptor plug domain-containing protein n=1 Tax=Aquimarina sp. MMG016 TaxID=2822690 RepID=UPI001B39E942|nr:TonB-dependent receptor [Aquimarina sp. MMG016]MBQ4821702.1 TonB-dependent receptor [Aquimarina sp. MMG016]
MKRTVIFFLILKSTLYSQEVFIKKTSDSLSSQQLEEVVISATRTERQLSSLPLPVTLISKSQIVRSGNIRLNEVLNEQTGIIMTPDATIGSSDGVQIQGIASDYILVLIDGVPVIGRSSGNLDLSRFAIGNIKQVEVVKGPSSSLFGSEALGGVINIITEKPKSDKISGQASHRYATFNGQNTNVSINQKINNIGYSLFIDRLSTDGYDLTPEQEGQTINPSYNYTFNGRFFFDISKKLKAFTSGRYFFQEFDVSPNTSEEKDLNAHLRFDHNPTKKIALQYELYYTNYITDEQTLDSISDEILFENDFNQRLLRPEIRFNYNVRTNNTITFGGGYNFESLKRTLFADNVTFDSQYIFGQYDFKPFEKLNIIAGARFDNHSVYNSQLSPKISFKYDFTSNISIKASVGSGFKAPDFRQLYLDFTNALGGGYTVFGKEVEAAGIQRLIDNDEVNESQLRVDISELGEPLDAESSIGYNLGFVYKKGKTKVDINFFRNDFKSLIDTRILAPKTNGQNVFGYINRNEIYTQGLEVDLKHEPFQNLSLSAGYQLLYAYDKEVKEEIKNGKFARDPLTGQDIRLSQSDYFGLENRSRHTANFKVFYTIPKWNANANLRLVYRSRFGLTDFNGNGFLDTFDNSFIKGFALVNLALSKTFYTHYKFQVGANNLFDYKGTSPFSNEQTGRILVNPGLQLFARFNYQF